MAKRKSAGKKRKSAGKKRKTTRRRRASAPASMSYMPMASRSYGGAPPHRDNTMMYVVIVFVVVAVVVLAVAAQSPGGLGGLFGGTTLAATTQSASGSSALWILGAVFAVGLVLYASSVMYRAEGGEGRFPRRAYTKAWRSGDVLWGDAGKIRDLGGRAYGGVRERGQQMTYATRKRLGKLPQIRDKKGFFKKKLGDPRNVTYDEYQAGLGSY